MGLGGKKWTPRVVSPGPPPLLSGGEGGYIRPWWVDSILTTSLDFLIFWTQYLFNHPRGVIKKIPVSESVVLKRRRKKMLLYVGHIRKIPVHFFLRVSFLGTSLLEGWCRRDFLHTQPGWRWTALRWCYNPPPLKAPQMAKYCGLELFTIILDFVWGGYFSPIATALCPRFSRSQCSSPSFGHSQI